MSIARLVAKRSTCARRAVGCVLVSDQNYVIATGYNGVPRGFVHCTISPCEGASASTGTSLDKCMAVHAEVNALLQCHDTQKIHTVYCTASPCVECAKALLNTPAKNFVFDECYEEHWPTVGPLLLLGNRRCTFISPLQKPKVVS